MTVVIACGGRGVQQLREKKQVTLGPHPGRWERVE